MFIFKPLFKASFYFLSETEFYASIFVLLLKKCVFRENVVGRFFSKADALTRLRRLRSHNIKINKCSREKKLTFSECILIFKD